MEIFHGNSLKIGFSKWVYKLFDKMFNNFECTDTSNEMKTISCMDNDYSAGTSINNCDIHDKSKEIVIVKVQKLRRDTGGNPK